MKKEFLKIGIALLVLLGLAIPLSLHRQKQFDKNDAQIKQERFINFDLSTIEKMIFTNKNGTVEVERRQRDDAGKFKDEFDSRSFEFKDLPQWIVVKPYRALVDAMLLDSFFSQIKDLSYQKIIQETKTQLKDYDLDPPIFSVSFYTKNPNEPELTVNMGGENPASTGFYFSASDKPGVYLAERVLQPYIHQSIQEWREKKVLGFPNTSVIEKISAKHADQNESSFTIVREKDIWKFEPTSENLLADSISVQDYLTHIDGIRSNLIMEDSTILRNSKLAGEVSLSIKDKKDPLNYKVFIGNKDSGLYYMQRSDLPDVFAIGVDSKIVPSYQKIVNKKLMIKDLSQIASLKIFSKFGEYEITKNENVWNAQKPFIDEVSPRRIDSLLQGISEIKSVEFLKNKTLNANDLKLKIEATLKDQSVHVVSLYQNGKNAFAKIEDTNKPRVLLIPQIPNILFEHIQHLRNDDLIPVAKQHVQRIIFSRGSARLEIEMGKKRQGWYLSSLDNVSASVSMKWKEELIPEEFYNRVSELYLTDFVSNPDPAMKFEMASLEIVDDVGKQYVWKFGQRQGEMIPLYSPDRKTVGRMPYTRFLELSTFLDEPVKKK